MRRRTIFSAFAAGMLALAPFSAALAAPTSSPQYVSSEPTNGAELHEAPEVVKVAFTEPLDASSELRVFACGTRVDDGETTVSLNQLEVKLTFGPSGIYQARWVAKGLGGITGSSAGFIEFSVGHGKASCEGHGSGHGGGHKDGGKGHGGGGGHEGEGHEGSGSGGSHSEGTHSSGSSASGSSGHSGTSHSAEGGASGHSSSGHSGTSTQGRGHGSGHSSNGSDKENGSPSVHGSGHGESTGADTEGTSNPDLASGGGPLPIPTPEAGAIFLALAACVGLGVTGGWLARLV